MGKSKDVGIIGYWFASNYGGVASYYGLYNKIKSLGYNPYLVETPYFATDREGEDVFSRQFFYSEKANVAPKLDKENLSKLNDLFDTFVLGSDQVMTTWAIKNFGDLFLMTFANKEKIRIGYSVSCGGDNLSGMDNDTFKFAKENIDKFSAISVREESAIDILKSKFNRQVEFNIDPIFFNTPKDFQKLAQKSSLIKEKAKYLCAYILDPNEDKKTCINKISSSLNIQSKIILDGRKFTHDGNFKKMNMPENTLDELDYYQWLQYYVNAEYVFTDSFHGAVMAIILNKPFIMYANPGRGMPRFISLASIFNLKSQLVLNSADVTLDVINSKFNFKLINKIISTYVESGEKWLSENLSRESFTSQNSFEGIENSVVAKLQLKDKCVGCSVCENICPTNAIFLQPNINGFLNPKINHDICTNCGLCAKRCVALNPIYKNSSEPECKAVMASDDIREISSSGGMFTLSAQYILKTGGYVCGAVYGNSFNVEHVLTNCVSKMEKMRGSKYYQSALKNVFKDIKNKLDIGKQVLFTGMPCQVAGLHSYLGKDYENLITIDLLCHGQSSQVVFEKYRKDVLGGRQLVDLQFKAKQPWGWHAGVNAMFMDGTRYSKILEEDKYFTAYINGISKNKPCGECLFNKLPRQGDLTIGDFWKIQNFDKNLFDNKGVSVVLVNNNRGKEFLKKINPTMNVNQNVPIEYAIAGNGIIIHPYKLHPNRDFFFDNLYSIEFSQLVDMCVKEQRERQIKSQMFTNLAPAEVFWYYLAKIVAENYNGRKVALWGESGELRHILKKYYNITVDCVLTVFPRNKNDVSIRLFDDIKDKSKEYYIAITGRPYDEFYYQKLLNFGYTDIKDFVYKSIKPIVLENLDLTKGTYRDCYGNIISGHGVVKQIVLRGYNNQIILANNIRGLSNLCIDVTSNNYINISEDVSFTRPDFKIMSFMTNGVSKIKIGKGCWFMNATIKCWGSKEGSKILINEKCTFNENFYVNVNQGKDLIIGRDCMFARDVTILAGDAHAIFDSNSGECLNLDYLDKKNSKNKIVIGEHVWVGMFAKIMHGTNIGNGSIIGMDSLVRNEFSNNCSVAGVPAKLIKTDVAWSRDMWETRVAPNSGYVKKTSLSKAPISGLNVLVVGGTGFMGKCLVKELIGLGNNVTISTRGKHPDSFGDAVNRIKVDVTNETSCIKAFSGKYFDVVFDDLAYDAIRAKNVLANIKCGKYVQIASTAVYNLNHFNIKESEQNPEVVKIKLLTMDEVGYHNSKQMAEAVAIQLYSEFKPVTVRIPFVTKTDRLYKYCKYIKDEIPMDIENIDSFRNFVQDFEVGKFLTWIAAQDYTGAINFCSNGEVSIRQILEYIERKLNKKAKLGANKKEDEVFHNFNKTNYTLNLDKVKQLGYNLSNLDDWFWLLMDEYIERVKLEK